MNFEGQNISLADALFVDNITGELETWRIKSDEVARALVFPPVNNYHRFLIHKVVETGFPEFTTFSVGEGEDRRTVVCFQQHLLDFTLGHHKWEKARDTGEFLPAAAATEDLGRPDTNFLQPVAAPASPARQDGGAVPGPAQPGPGRRRKRPERAVYVPPCGRGKPLSPNAVEFRPNSVQHQVR